MPKYYKFICNCGYAAMRYRNCKRCPNCGGDLVRIEPTTPQDAINSALRELYDARYCMVDGNTANDPIDRDVVNDWLDRIESELVSYYKEEKSK